ncbi:exostosin-2 isoform X1 [Macrobrachium rosenbergii]|uniref:exostosin-2 isoform X1 n=2 Tax=Macrobrachium rosenbergii TaxID=79674 RepID=UPI0034D47D7C
MNSFDSIFYRWKYRNFFISLLIVLVCGIILLGGTQLFNWSITSSHGDARVNLETWSHWQELMVDGKETPDPTPTRFDCHYFNCFNVYRCGRGGHQQLSVYVYPMTRYVDEDRIAIKPISREFYEIIDTILNSEYYTSNPYEACLFIPPIDTLNENNLRKDKIAKALAMLPHWKEGENHLLFNMLPGTPPLFDTALNMDRGKAILAGGGFSSLTYRRGFDVSLPVYNPVYQDVPPNRKESGSRRWLIVSSQVNIHRDYREDLEAQMLDEGFKPDDLLLLDKCYPFTNLTVRCHGSQVFQYPQILNEAKFCLVIRGGRLGQSVLYDAMRAGCIPIIVADSYVLPFSEVIDWQEAAIQIYEEDLPTVLQAIQKDVSEERIEEMQKQVIWLYETYFSTMKDITLTTLKILNDRIFSAHAKSLRQWNKRPEPSAVNNPLFLPITAPVNEGFTAVILTYDRLESLFQVIQTMVQVPSLSKVLVVWNNQKKAPPQASMWPKINVPLKVVQTRENKLSNRFYPYEEIETECILAIDDDINMMTADELEFGYQVWREFPDRIVGFPPRNVLWNNDTHSWKYDSEWTNEVSMVLTGVAFYHKYWSYVYTTQLPGNIKEWVDTNMNCEDIAMNFLVANLTGKAPIKVS